MQWNWLISPLAGSIIGYGTNYLAIKMLFRPHKAYYIGKFKVPFTPGLIPKEKKLLATKIGQTVEEHLLNEDVLIQTLISPKAKEALFSMIRTIPEHMENSNQTIAELVHHVLGTDIDQNMGIVTDQLIVEIITAIRSQEVREIIVPRIVDGMADMIEQYLSTIMQDSHTISEIERWWNHVLQDEQVKECIERHLEKLQKKISTIDAPIIQCIPGQYIDWIHQIVEHNAQYIGENIIRAVEKGEGAERIKSSIQHWADQYFNPMISMFIKVDKIYESVIQLAKKALEDEQNVIKLGELLNDVIDGILQQSPANLLRDQEKVDNYKKEMINILQQQVNSSNIQSLLSIVTDGFGYMRHSDIHQKIQYWLYNQWDVYMNKEIAFDLSRKIIEELIQFIGSTPVNNLSMLIPSSTVEQFGEKVFEYYTKLIRNHSRTIADMMDISGLVESRIHHFSSEEAEEIIISVVNHQLQAITWLGALLGFIIGVIPNLIS